MNTPNVQAPLPPPQPAPQPPSQYLPQSPPPAPQYQTPPGFQQPYVRLDHTFQPPKGYKLKRKRRWPWVITALVAVLMVVGALGARSDEADPSAAGARRDSGSAQPLAVGSTDTTSGFEVTLLQVQDPFVSTNQFDRPSEGRRHVAVEMSLVNTTNEMKPFSTLLGLELVDSLGQHWNIALAGVELPSLDAEVGAGSTMRGWAVFEIPIDSTGLQLNVKGSLTASGITFTL